MHGLCSEGEGNSTRLAKCPRDFVEAPSQMLENWCWQPEVLVRLSKHHVSGEPLPKSLMQTMIAAKNVHESVFMMLQIYLATLDLSIHGAYNGGAVPSSTLVTTVSIVNTVIITPFCAGCELQRYRSLIIA